MPKEKFKLLNKGYARGVKFVTFAMGKVPTEKGDGMIMQDMAVIMATQDQSGEWTLTHLIHKDGVFEDYPASIYATDDLIDWCSVQ